MIENKKPVYVPEPLVEYNPDEFKPVEFDECFKPLIEHFKRIQSEPEVKPEQKPMLKSSGWMPMFSQGIFRGWLV
jgi:hypothetical protein